MFPPAPMLAAVCALVIAQAPLATAQESDVLEAARTGLVTPADELLAELLEAGPGAAGAFVAQLLEAIEQEKLAGLRDLLVQVERLPAEVLEDRRSIPADALTAQRWARGTGIALDVIAEFGNTEGLLLLRSLAQAPDHIGDDVLAMQQRPLESTVRKVLQRRTSAYSAVGTLYRDLPEWAASAVLRAIASTRSLDGLHALPALLGKRSPLDAYALTQIASIARFARAPLNDGELDRIRRYLASELPDERRNAAQALGFLDDAESIPPLIELLRDPNQGVIQSAYSALRLITAMTIDPGYRLWVSWHGRESSWWRSEAAPHLAQIESRRTRGMVVALRELGSKRLFRREIAPIVRPLLHSRRDETVRISLSALTSLRANDEDTLASMEELLDHSNPVIREQASASLRVITRREYRPSDPPARPR